MAPSFAWFPAVGARWLAWTRNLIRHGDLTPAGPPLPAGRANRESTLLRQ